jgi:hypothetical protein
MKNNLLLVLLCALFTSGIYAQTDEQRQQIIKNYDLEKLRQIERRNQIEFEENYALALEMAREKGWEIKFTTEEGSVWELMGVMEDGTPIYHAEENEGGAVTTRADRLYPGGALGLDLTGDGMIIGMWEVDAALPQHQLFQGRLTQVNPDQLSNHASHVGGTLIGGDDVQNNARGMAYEARIRAFNSTNDEAEMANEASNGLLISNHSYGIPGTSVSSWYRGKYDASARDIDEIMYNAPYYIAVVSAGNDRNNGINSTGYDILTDKSTNKNGLTVAAVRQVNNYFSPQSVNMSSFSSWGPPDDGRIKPDISGKGVNMYSASSSSVTGYYVASGTSMSAPNVAGTLTLWQQHYMNTFGTFMLSSTLRGLALHTALEAGDNSGPDYEYGWGLLNSERAANTINTVGQGSIISELDLNEGETYTIQVYASTTEDLHASITWTDPEGVVGPNITNDRTPILVNDLDLRVTQDSMTYLPWKLNPVNPSAPATMGDNDVDNIEKIEIENPMGLYTITVSHKGNLTDSSQTFSLIVTGVGDCTGTYGGSAYVDSCGVCAEGNTGITACPQDCFGDWGGTAFIDSCGFCADGNTGFIPVLDSMLCSSQVLPSAADYIQIYPNPTDGILNIEILDSLPEGTSLYIYSVDGKMVYGLNSIIDPILNIDLKGNAEGAYYLRLTGPSVNAVERLILKK